MSEKIKATSPEQLRRVVDALHDSWFDLDGLVFNKEEGRVTLRFWKASKYAGRGTPDAECVISGVRDVSIIDALKVGYYDLNEITYDGGTLRIKTGVPLDMALRVDRVAVAVNPTE